MLLGDVPERRRAAGANFGGAVGKALNDQISRQHEETPPGPDSAVATMAAGEF